MIQAMNVEKGVLKEASFHPICELTQTIIIIILNFNVSSGGGGEWRWETRPGEL